MPGLKFRFEWFSTGSWSNGRAEVWSGRLATLAVVAGGAWMLASLVWQFPVSPPPPPVPPPDRPWTVGRQVAGRHLFGEPGAASSAARGEAVASDYHLPGVIAGQPGIAILNCSGN